MWIKENRAKALILKEIESNADIFLYEFISKITTVLEYLLLELS